MAVAAYSRWNALGRPSTPAQPIRDVVERMRIAYPRATFSWYANEAHYTAIPAEDHTPFSQTGWPVASPEWWVFATDIMHRPDLGVDCNLLFRYWIGEARGGRMPWLKYIIWQAKLYDVRNGWDEQANSGHYDHIHFSARTDFKDRGLGSWSITPTGTEDDMDYNQSAKLDAIFDLKDTVTLDTDGTPDGKGATRSFPVPVTKFLKDLSAKVTAPAPVTVDPVVLAAAVNAAVQAAFASPTPAFLTAVAKAVVDEDHRRSAE